MHIKKLTALAIPAALGLFFCSTLLAQGTDTAALKQRILSKVKVCNCEETIDKCGNCPVAAEIKDYVNKLIEAKVPENKMLGYILKSFPQDVLMSGAVNEEATKQLKAIVPADGPRLDAAVKDFDFGKVPQKAGSINHEFTLRNTGKQDLIITSLRASCSCARVSLRTASGNSPDFDSKGSGPGWQGKIKPGEAAIMEIVLDLASFTVDNKPAARQVFVTTNDPLQSVAVFKVSLEVTGS